MTETAADAWTIQRLLGWTAEHFTRHRRDVPRLAAEILLSEALGCRRIDLYARYGEVPGEPALARFRDWVRRHAAGEPVAYLVGYRDFYSHRFDVGPAVLIPRSETEQVVMEAIGLSRAAAALRNGDPVRVLEVGTGSGCIAITLALEAPPLRITATDISPDALAVARGNAERLLAASRDLPHSSAVDFLESDLDAALPASDRFDLIVSNPPYIGRSEQGTVAPDVQSHEPHLALYGGEQGWEFTDRLATMAARRLVPGGHLVFETSPFIAQICRGHLEQSAAWDQIRVLRDLAGHDRVVIARNRGAG